MLKKWQFWTVMTAIVALMSVFTFGFTRNPKEVRSVLIDLPAPVFSVTELNSGVPLSLGDLKGTPFLLNFWASWCVACREESRLLEAAHQRWGKDARKFRVVGIAVQDRVADARKFARRFGKTYYLALDNPTGDIFMNYGVYGVPESFFVDADGVIRYKMIGVLTQAVIDEQVPALMGTAPNPKAGG